MWSLDKSNHRFWHKATQLLSNFKQITLYTLDSKNLSKNLKARCVYFKPEVTNSWSAWPLNIVRDDKSGYHSVLLQSCSHFSDNISDPPSRGPAWLHNIKSVTSVLRQLQYILILKRFQSTLSSKSVPFEVYRVLLLSFLYNNGNCDNKPLSYWPLSVVASLKQMQKKAFDISPLPVLLI